MWARWRKSRADRQLWRQAESLPELCGLMARWLEGELSMWPGYDDWPDEETADLIPVLARANRAGFLTDQSQPGFDGPGFDGSRWEQRAAVSGLVGNRRLMDALHQVAWRYDLKILTATVEGGMVDGWTVTKVDGEPYTVFGRPMSRRILHQIWRGVSGSAFDAIASAVQVTLIDPEFGRTDRLWAALDEALNLLPA